MNLQIALDHRARVEEFQRKHRIGLLTLVFTDIAGSTQLKQELGDQEGLAIIHHHHALLREILRHFKEAEEISTAGDSFFLVFAKPSDAVKFALQLQTHLAGEAKNSPCVVSDRIGIHVGEVFIVEAEGWDKPKDLYGLQVDTCARVMSLAKAGQVLMTRFVFDNARQVLRAREVARGEDPKSPQELKWLNHGPYRLKGVEDPLEICEVGMAGVAALSAPANSEKARRHLSDETEPVLGWRPAVELRVPGTEWVLEKKLGEGGFGEVWLGRHERLKDRRVFKFCFRADRVRSLKREVTLFRVLKERVGHHLNIVGVQEVYFNEAPYYIVMDYAEAKDLRAWAEERGGLERVSLEEKLEIVAQMADGLQAAHAAGVIHRDVKPSNILVSNPKSDPLRESDSAARIGNPKLDVKLTDFGIGQVVSQEALAGMTRMGFTQTMLSPGSSSQTGTQLYMAPELLSGKAASVRSDIYSLGVVLYQLLVGDFTRPVTTDWDKRIQDPLLREDLEKCFAGDPEERFGGSAALAKSLRELEPRRRQLAMRERARRRWRGVRLGTVGLLLAIGLIIVGLYVTESENSSEPGTKNMQAYDYYKRGKSQLFTNKGEAQLDSAIEEFAKAIAKDPDYALAHARLGYAYRLKDVVYHPGEGWDAKSLKAIERAIDLNPRLPEAYVMRGSLFFTPSKKWDAVNAVRDQKKALALNRKVLEAHYNLAFVYYHIGFLDEALTELKEELRLHPLNTMPLWLKGETLRVQGKYQEAFDCLSTVPQEAFPHPVHQPWEKAACLLYSQRTNEARRCLSEELLRYPNNPLLMSLQAVIYAADGDQKKAEEAIEITKKGEARLIHFHHAAYQVGCAYALMEKPEAAVQWLSKAADEGYPGYQMFRDDQFLKPLQQDPAFKRFMEQLKEKHESNKERLF